MSIVPSKTGPHVMMEVPSPPTLREIRTMRSPRLIYTAHTLKRRESNPMRKKHPHTPTLNVVVRRPSFPPDLMVHISNPAGPSTQSAIVRVEFTGADWERTKGKTPSSANPRAHSKLRTSSTENSDPLNLKLDTNYIHSSILSNEYMILSNLDMCRWLQNKVIIPRKIKLRITNSF